jgi:hypothetical protein
MAGVAATSIVPAAAKARIILLRMVTSHFFLHARTRVERCRTCHQRTTAKFPPVAPQVKRF